MVFYLLITKKIEGPDRGSNPEPLAPKARIIPLDHQALYFVKVILFYQLEKTDEKTIIKQEKGYTFYYDDLSKYLKPSLI